MQEMPWKLPDVAEKRWVPANLLLWNFQVRWHLGKEAEPEGTATKTGWYPSPSSTVRDVKGHQIKMQARKCLVSKSHHLEFSVKFYPLPNSGNRIRDAASMPGGIIMALECVVLCGYVGLHSGNSAWATPLLTSDREWIQCQEVQHLNRKDKDNS